MTDELISVIEIAKTHGKHRQTIHRILKRLGVETTKMQSSEARGQLATYISKADYERIRDEFNKSETTNGEDDESVGPGVFYVIQLEPDHDPGRFKVGFATSIQDRLRQHKTAAPYSVLLNTWPCKLLWEKTAIDSVTQGCKRLHTEVFLTDNLNQVVERCNQFFSLMPELDNE